MNLRDQHLHSRFSVDSEADPRGNCLLVHWAALKAAARPCDLLVQELLVAKRDLYNPLYRVPESTPWDYNHRDMRAPVVLSLSD